MTGRHATLLLICLAGCANPMPPTGGPADDVPPEVRGSQPADQAVMVDARTMTIAFSEFVEEASFVRAFSITPEFSEPVEVSWRGRTATIRFPESLRPNTTYIIQIDNNLRDVHGVSLTRPITLAFATGTRIDIGRIRGRVVDSEQGAPVAGIDVFAYREVDPDTLRTLPAEPDYRTQTGADGSFDFRYLPEGVAYYVVAFADANRNRAPEPLESFASPPRPLVRADTIAPADSASRPWVTTRIDTTAPEAQRAQMRTSRRIEVRYSEPVRIVDTLVTWAVVSTSGDFERTAMPYVPLDGREVGAIVDSLPPGSYQVLADGLVDSVGNPASAALLPFEVTPVRDTISVRFMGFESDTLAATPLAPGESPVLAFSSGVSAQNVRALVSVADTLGQPLPFSLSTDSRTEWSLHSSALDEARPIVVALRDPAGADTIHTHRFVPLTADALGEIRGVVTSSAVPVVVEITGSDLVEPRIVRTDADGRFLAARLPAGAYFLRAYVDVDSSASWSGGALAPYEASEAITWRADSVRVRARWETTLEDTLRLPAARPQEP